MIDLSLPVAAPEGVDLVGDSGNKSSKLGATFQLVPEFRLDRVHHVQRLQPVQSNVVQHTNAQLVWLGVDDTMGGGPPLGEVTSRMVTKSLKECEGILVGLFL